jgi:hypothetical protein
MGCSSQTLGEASARGAKKENVIIAAVHAVARGRVKESGKILKQPAAIVALACAMLMSLTATAAAHTGGSGEVAAAPPINYGVADDTSKYATDGGAWFYGMLHGANLTENRWTLAWDPANPTAISELPFIERAAPVAEAAGIHVVLALYSKQASQHDPVAFCAWAALVAKTVQRWGIHDFIVWNEPNTALYWSPQKDASGKDIGAAAYEQLLATCYDTIHAADSQARVIGFGLSPRASGPSSNDPLPFVRDVGIAYKASGRTTPIMDQMAIHPYPNPNRPTDSPDIGYPAGGDNNNRFGIPNLDRVKQAVYDAFNGTGQPTTLNGLTFRIDEVGWQTDTTGYPQYYNAENVAVVSEQTQADYIAEAVQKYFACDPTVTDVEWFLLVDEASRNGKDQSGNVIGGGWQSGLLTAGGQGISQPKAAYAKVGPLFAQGRAACTGQQVNWAPAKGILKKKHSSPGKQEALALSFSKSQLGLGKVVIGGAGVTKTLTATNLTGHSITLGSISTSKSVGDVGFAANLHRSTYRAGLVLAAGAHCKFVETFTAKTVGAGQATFGVTVTNAAGRKLKAGTITITLIGVYNNQAFAWGSNGHGQLGNGSTASSATPVAVEGVGGSGTLLGVTALAAGGSHSLALLSGGTVDAWGYNGVGQLGNGSTTGSITPVAVEGVGGSGALSGVTAIAAGDASNLALLSGGTVVAWGVNDAGQLGDDTSANSDTPVAVEGVGGSGTLSGVTAIAAGASEGLALLSGGTVDAWGWNAHGELGIGSTGGDSTTPVAVEGVGGSGTLSGVTAIAAGENFCLALLSGGTVDAWGDGLAGQLGNNKTVDSSTPVVVQQVGGGGTLSGVTAIAAGGFQSLALLSDGTVVTWGPNSTPVAVPGLSNVVAITANLFEDYALEANGTLWTWSGDVPAEVTGLGTVTAIGGGPEAQHILVVAHPAATG